MPKYGNKNFMKVFIDHLFTSTVYKFSRYIFHQVKDFYICSIKLFQLLLQTNCSYFSYYFMIIMGSPV